MSDSESDLLPSNIFTFQNENTIISAKGPNGNSTNMTNLSFRNNVMTSTMCMPRNFERQRFGEPSYDQRSMYYRRETSPVSMYSGLDRQRNFPQSYYGGGMSSQRSMINYGRSGSPMSMRSMDSNASLSAVDIAMAFKNVNFNKNDWRIIKDAYNKFMKRRVRKRIEKRRNIRLFLKGYRHKSGYDSGEQGSDSSISSDDCKSTSSAMYKDNMSCRSSRTDMINFRRTLQDTNMYKDCTNNFKSNAFKNMFSVGPVNNRDRLHMNNMRRNPPFQQKEFAVPQPVEKPAFTQKERFNSGYQLPSQRFNKSVASVPILERDPRLRARQNTIKLKNKINETAKHNDVVSDEHSSDQEEIFSEVTVREKSTCNIETQNNKITAQGKRNLEIEDSNRCSDRKRSKLSSPLKQPTTKAVKNYNGIIERNQKEDTAVINKDEFEFVKPQFPVRKSGSSKIKESLISKSAPPLIDEILPPSRPQLEKDPATSPKMNEVDNPPTATEEPSDATLQPNNDVSMRPSFIKRKLFSQKMDVTERKNLNADALNVNSPQTNVYSTIQKEKHKARKLVTNQSCLSRDIVQEGNNLLDLIHKIVPPDRMNMTNITNKTSIGTSVSSKNPIDDEDKWDVTSVISTCVNDDVSDTYTDEEIFRIDDSKKKVENNINTGKNVNNTKENDKPSNIADKQNEKDKMNNANKITQNECRILLEKLPVNKLPSKVQVNKPDKASEANDLKKKSAYNCVKSFWDTDFESDLESPAPKRPMLKPDDKKENQKSTFINFQEKNIPKHNKTLNLSLVSVSESIKSKTMPTNNIGVLKKFNISKNLSIKAFLTPKKVNAKPKQVVQVQDEAKEKTITEQLPKLPKTQVKNKKSPKQATNTKTAKNVSAQDTKREVKKTKNNGDLLNSASKTNKSQSKSKGKSTKAPKAEQNNTILANKSIAGRTLRTPKRKVCCSEPKFNSEKDDSMKLSETKSQKSKPKDISNSNKPKPTKSNSPKDKTANKLDNTICHKPETNKSLKKINNSHAKQSQTKSVKNKKKFELETREPDNLDTTATTKILRSRHIDLSSSINSSMENVTLQIRNLRTRRVNLSDSLKNSSLDETIKEAPQSTISKKSPAKPNRTENLKKKPRSVKNRVLK